jgi:transmembrane sensor
MQLNDNIQEIIAKQLQNEATAEEVQLLQRWRMEDAENEKNYQAFSNAWLASDVSILSNRYSTENAWNAIDRKINRRPAKRIAFNAIRLSVAASVIGLMIIGSILFFNTKTSSLIRETATAANKTITLPDGSSMILREGSSAEWSSDFKQRNVHLKGEAFFDVQHDAQHPFSVVSIHSTVTVLGTSFTINTNAIADLVTVIRGKVAVQTGSEKAILTAGEAIQANEHLSTKINAETNAAAWQTGILKFAETPLRKVLTDVSNVYNRPVIIQPTELADKYTVTLRFEKQPINEVVNEIALVTGLSQRTAGDTIILYKK